MPTALGACLACWLLAVTAPCASPRCPAALMVSWCLLATQDDVDTAFQSSKRQRVQMHESQWLAELERLEKAKEKAEGGGTGGGLFGGGRLKNVIDTVIGGWGVCVL